MGDNKNKVLIKNVTSLSVVQIANLVLPLISFPIISRILGPEKYGIINFAASFITYFNLLIDYGFNLTATRRVAKEPLNEENRNIVFQEVLSAKIVLFTISVIIFLITLFTVTPLSKEKIVAVFSFLICISTVLTQNWLFQAMQNLNKIAILNLIGKVLFTIFILLVIRDPKDYIWQPFITSIIAILISLISFIWAIKTYNLRFTFTKWKRLKTLLWKEKTIFFSTVVVSLYTTTNIVILGFIQSNKEVGIYTAAQRLIIIAMSIVNMPITQALYPFISRSFGESKAKGIETVKKCIPLLFYFLFLLSLGMFIFGPLLIHILNGDKFSESIILFRILCILPFLIGISNILGIQIMLNTYMDKIFLYITSIGAVVGILLNIFLTYKWGNVGTAINWVIIETLITCIMYCVLYKRHIKPIDIKEFVPKKILSSVQQIIMEAKKKK